MPADRHHSPLIFRYQVEKTDVASGKAYDFMQDISIKLLILKIKGFFMKVQEKIFPGEFRFEGYVSLLTIGLAVPKKGELFSQHLHVVNKLFLCLFLIQH